jgi:hypothetical protein
VALTDRVYYVITWRPAYAELLGLGPEARLECVLATASSNGFGEDVGDPLLTAKLRFLDTELSFQGLELDRSEEVFDCYFEIFEPDQVIDLDE